MIQHVYEKVKIDCSMYLSPFNLDPIELESDMFLNNSKYARVT